MILTLALLVPLIAPHSVTSAIPLSRRLHETACAAFQNPGRCAERNIVIPVASAAVSNWKFVRSKGRAETGDVVSITRTADLQQSDPDFAGLMVRCASHGRVDVLVVLVSPFPPQTRPQVTITAGQGSRVFEGKMTAAGAAVVLPDEAALLAAAPWQTTPQLAISVRVKDTEIKGVVALDGLRPAYANLVGSCAQ